MTVKSASEAVLFTEQNRKEHQPDLRVNGPRDPTDEEVAQHEILHLSPKCPMCVARGSSCNWFFFSGGIECVKQPAMFLFLIAHRVAPAQSRIRTQSSSCPIRVCNSGLVGTHERDHKARSRTRVWISVTNHHIQTGPNNSRKLCQLPAINLLEALREPSKKLRVRFEP